MIQPQAILEEEAEAPQPFQYTVLPPTPPSTEDTISAVSSKMLPQSLPSSPTTSRRKTRSLSSSPVRFSPEAETEKGFKEIIWDTEYSSQASSNKTPSSAANSENNELDNTTPENSQPPLPQPSSSKQYLNQELQKNICN